MWNFHTSFTSPMRVLSCGQFITDVPFQHSARNLQSYVLLLGLEGALHLTQGETPHLLRPGDALLLRPDENHFGHRCSDAPLSYYWCHFLCPSEARFLSPEAAAREMARLRDIPQEAEGVQTLILPEFAHYRNADRLVILYQQLLHRLNANPYTAAIADYSLTLLMMEMTQQWMEYGLEDATGKESRIQRVLEWTRINCVRPISVREIAQRFYYNPDYLSTLCRQHTGMTMQQYIHNCKMERAKTMLLNTRESIYAISQSLGFSDDKYFMRLFKQYVKITPTAFRNAFGRTHLNQR